MKSVTAFGLFAVTAMLVLAFAASCLLGSAYGFLQGPWRFGVVEFIWAGVAVRRWWLIYRLKDKWRYGRQNSRSVLLV